MTSRSLRGLKFVGVLALLALAGFAYADTSAVDEFGVATSEPIEGSAFFSAGKYIEPPYVVERRGLEIYINDILVDPGPEWPIYDFAVPTDPGDPPPGSSPFDTYPPGTDLRDVYWSKKWRYLYSHYDHETAKQMMCDTYRSGSGVRDVSGSDLGEDIIRVTGESGRDDLVSLSLTGGGFAINPPKKEDLLRRMERKMAHQERRLRGTRAFFKKGGRSIIVGGERAIRAVEILLSDATDAEKIKALEEAGVLAPSDESARWIVTDFEASPQLAEQLERMKDAMAAGKARAELAQLAHASEDDLLAGALSDEQVGASLLAGIGEEPLAAAEVAESPPASPETAPAGPVAQVSDARGGLPAWLWALIAVALVAGAGAILHRRRKAAKS